MPPQLFEDLLHFSSFTKKKKKKKSETNTISSVKLKDFYIWHSQRRKVVRLRGQPFPLATIRAKEEKKNRKKFFFSTQVKGRKKAKDFLTKRSKILHHHMPTWRPHLIPMGSSLNLLLFDRAQDADTVGGFQREEDLVRALFLFEYLFVSFLIQ